MKHYGVWLLLLSVLGGLKASLVSLTVWKRSTELLIVSLSLVLSKLTTVLSPEGRGSEEPNRESKNREIGKFSLLRVCSKANGKFPEDELIKWALARAGIGVKADFGPLRKLSGPRAYLKLSARRAAWWKSRSSWGGLAHGFGAPKTAVVASLLYLVRTSSIACTKSPPQEWRISCKTLTLIFGNTRMRSSIADARLCPENKIDVFSTAS